MAEGKMKGRVALVTGGGTGIGRATATAYAREGASVAVNYSRSAREAEETAAELRDLGVEAIAVQADVSDDRQVRSMLADVEQKLGLVDTLVNNAGRTHFVPYPDLEGVTEEIWDDIIGVNVKGAFFCARAAAAQMRRKGQGGVVVNVASIAGITGRGSSIPYAASKGAMVNLTKALALALAPDIRVTAVAPSVVTTRWVAGWEDFVKQSEVETPMKRNATADDVAEVILALTVSAGFVTGKTIVVDGGRILG
jgi:3-oxoacyl-[acyl-carrier protein] reductase